MRRITILALLLVVSALLPARPVAAKGAFDRVTISGPGLTGELAVTATMLHLPFIDNLEDDRSPIAPPVNPGAGYDLIRYYGFRAFDHVRYYPDRQGGRGAVYYVGIVNGAGPDDGKWFPATEAGERVLLRVLAEQGAPPARSGLLPATGAESRSDAFPLLASALLGTGLLFLGRRLHRVSAARRYGRPQ